jgi:drug/metabolite transporter (DMT)-like permease
MPLGIKPEAIVATQLILATVTILPFYLATGITDGEVSITPLLSMAALGIFGSGFAYLWNFRVMEIAGSAISSSVTYLTPVVAVVAGIIFLGESISWHEPVGALVVLLGAAIAQERIKLTKQ